MAVNADITDAVTQTNVKVLGEAPAEAVGISNQVLSHTVGLSMENATQTQGSMQQLATSATMGLLTLIIESSKP